MYVLILIFVSVTGVAVPSEHAIPFATQAQCSEEGPPRASYESGVEAGTAKANGTKPDKVWWYCVPVKVPGPTT